MPHDAAIIGGGIVGLSTAMALAEQTRASIIVLEAEGRVAPHQTSHNSGVIHAGLYYKPGSLKARNCVTGREMMYDFCQKHGVPHERCGKVVVATSESEIPYLEKLHKRGHENGLTDVRRLSVDELHEYEPHVAGVAALHVPATGIIDYRLVAEKYAELTAVAGGEIATGRQVVGVASDGNEHVIQTTGGEVRARHLINCGGLQADRVARICGLKPDLLVIPFRGEYYELTPDRRSLVRNLIYPVPDPRFPFLGVHFTRMIGGGVEAGPNAVLALARHGYRWSNISPRDLLEMFTYRGLWRLILRHWRTSVDEVYRSLSKRAFVRALRKLIPELGYDDVIPGGSGVRAQAIARDGSLVDDFHILDAERMIHVLNAPSPAATASLAIGQSIAERAVKRFELR